MAYLDKRVIRTRARTLLKEHDLLALPVRVDRLAKKMGISLRYEPLEGDLSGMAFIKGDIKVVAINSFHAENRKRFRGVLAGVCFSEGTPRALGHSGLAGGEPAGGRRANLGRNTTDL